MIEVAKILLMRTNFVGASEPMVLSEIIYILIEKAERIAFRKRISKKTWTIGQGFKGDPRKTSRAFEVQVPGGTAIDKPRPTYFIYCSLYHCCNQPYPLHKLIYLCVYIYINSNIKTSKTLQYYTDHIMATIASLQSIDPSKPAKYPVTISEHLLREDRPYKRRKVNIQRALHPLINA